MDWVVVRAEKLPMNLIEIVALWQPSDDLCVCVCAHVKWSLSIYSMEDNPCFCCTSSTFQAKNLPKRDEPGEERARGEALMSERKFYCSF